MTIKQKKEISKLLISSDAESKNLAREMLITNSYIKEWFPKKYKIIYNLKEDSYYIKIVNFLNIRIGYYCKYSNANINKNSPYKFSNYEECKIILNSLITSKRIKNKILHKIE